MVPWPDEVWRWREVLVSFGSRPQRPICSSDDAYQSITPGPHLGFLFDNLTSLSAPRNRAFKHLRCEIGTSPSRPLSHMFVPWTAWCPRERHHRIDYHINTKSSLTPISTPASARCWLQQHATPHGREIPGVGEIQPGHADPPFSLHPV